MCTCTYSSRRSPCLLLLFEPPRATERERELGQSRVGCPFSCPVRSRDSVSPQSRKCYGTNKKEKLSIFLTGGKKKERKHYLTLISRRKNKKPKNSLPRRNGLGRVTCPRITFWPGMRKRYTETCFLSSSSSFPRRLRNPPVWITGVRSVRKSATISAFISFPPFLLFLSDGNRIPAWAWSKLGQRFICRTRITYMRLAAQEVSESVSRPTNKNKKDKNGDFFIIGGGARNSELISDILLRPKKEELTCLSRIR